MTGLVLSRIRLRRDASARALAPLLLPEGQARIAAAHRLVWALFADGEDRRRDFLWREEAPGRFLALSARPPAAMDLFDVDSTAFEPALSVGDRLGFALRANAVIARSGGPGQRGRRHDVVMDALRSVPLDARAAARLDAVVAAGRAWIARQGASHGFTPEPDAGVDGYERVRIEREGPPAIFGTIDFNGALRVDDPAPVPERFGGGVRACAGFWLRPDADPPAAARIADGDPRPPAAAAHSAEGSVVHPVSSRRAGWTCWMVPSSSWMRTACACRSRWAASRA